MATYQLNVPTDLDERSALVYRTIERVLRERDLVWTGGGHTFYSPQAWAERGESYGLRSALIVCYDGGYVREAFAPYGPDCSAYDAMHDALAEIGFYMEACTGWYSAIYPIHG